MPSKESTCIHRYNLQKFNLPDFERQSMIHKVLTVGRPALNSAKQPLISFNKLQVYRRLHNPARSNYQSSSRISPIQLRNRCQPASFGQRQITRYCSYKSNMCKAKDDLAVASVDVSKGREVLPANVKPVHYSLTLEPDFDKFTYEGEVVIEYVKPIIQQRITTQVRIQ